jgi:hypothetical protein
VVGPERGRRPAPGRGSCLRNYSHARSRNRSSIAIPNHARNLAVAARSQEELRLLRVLWENGAGTVREAREAVVESTGC